MAEKKTKLKAGCGIAMVFGAGFACGAIALFTTIMWIVPLSEGMREDESKQFITKHIAKQLELTEEQLKLAKPIIHAAIDQRNNRRREFVEADIKLTGEAFKEMKGILNQEQIKMGVTMLERWKQGKTRLIDKNFK
ncbi:MAG: hypothetical protein CMO61_05075 [Verrucomicrobiales bacterium]|jgi:hypothetical protein|nr:hypothetical protein [Verrucomicrobiales bacterium]|tara:strand:- start:14875 stop:15282 length:408 start_codon:yes stop_codon:yes gene_type:complete